MRGTTAAALAATIVLAACGAKVIDHGTGGDGTGGEVPGGVVLLSDCRDEGCNHRPGDTEGVWAAGGCDACFCQAFCDDDEDCLPAPSTGTSVPACSEPDGVCVLPCDAGQLCPDGMLCVTDANFPAIELCAWAQTDALYCYDEEPSLQDDPCAQYTTAEACSAIVSEVAAVRCSWARRSILAAGSQSCDVVTSEELCVAVRGEHCDPIAQCSTGGGAHWRDLGAGTAEMIEVSDCSWRPYGEWEPCDFTGDVPIPLVCGCACGGADPTGGELAGGGACECNGAG